MSTRYVNLPPKAVAFDTIERPLWLNSCVLLEEQDDNETTDPYCKQLRMQLEREPREEQI